MRELRRTNVISALSLSQADGAPVADRLPSFCQTAFPLRTDVLDVFSAATVIININIPGVQHSGWHIQSIHSFLFLNRTETISILSTLESISYVIHSYLPTTTSTIIETKP